MHTAKLSAPLLVMLALVLGTAPARAETISCTAITTLPYVITVQGIYCLTGYLNTAITSGYVIDIQTNNVVLDLNSFKLGGLAAGPGTHAYGIHAVNHQNITIKNGTIRGFYFGIFLEGSSSQGHIIEDIRADQNTVSGIAVSGSGYIVRNNQVVATGGTTVLGANADAYGIFLSMATSVRVLNNDVINTVKQGSGTAYGIYFQNVTGGLAVNNRITQADKGIFYFFSTGKYRDNLTDAVTTPFTGGTDAGNND